MRVIHMDSGLGNQMLDYAEYLAIREINPDGEYYLENLIYELPHMPGMFSQWNGYELERIFGIRLPNIKECFDQDQWEEILKEVAESQFWKEDWNFAPYIVEAFQRQGLKLVSMIPDKRPGLRQKESRKAKLRGKLTDFFRTAPGYHTKRLIRKVFRKYVLEKKNQSIDVFRKYPQDVLAGQYLAVRYKGFRILRIEKQIREAFQFPPILDEKNLRMLELIRNTNSVSIHARRSDMLFVNGDCYRYGYFKRAVRYIRERTEKPVFVFFCDENSTGWCEKNEKIFNLDFQKDDIYFVDWNKGLDSFRDMQLMAQCKHNIFTQSSFGFWGAWLNENPNKITCAPDILFEATNSF